MFSDMPQGDHKKRAKYRFASKTLMRILPEANKKEKRRLCGSSFSVTGDQEDGSCLGSEKQWLPQGLLSAESESCGDSARSESASSDEREVSSQRPHRKLGVTLSVPTYASFSGHSSSGSSVGSDYYSQISPGSIG